MALINCPECNSEISDQAGSCPRCGFAILAMDVPEEVLVTAHPVMFKARPLVFLLCVALIAALGIGLLILLGWWLSCKARTITITNKRTTIRSGLVSKHTSEVLHKHVRNIQVKQGVVERMFGVGTLAIASAGTADVELEFSSVVDPESLKKLIEEHRR